MASGTPAAHKRSSLHRLSHTLLSLASPSFARAPFDPPSRKKPSPATTSTLDPRDDHSYSPSIVSAVDSQLSSPYTPLLPSPGSLALASPPSVPPTTNELSEGEKMKLMRKVRKLSRVLGEIPSVEEEDADHLDEDDEVQEMRRSTSMDAPGGSKIRSASASAKKAFRRSMTFGTNSGSALLKAHDLRHIRSLSALRPSLNIPCGPPSSDALGPPSSPITFARPESAMSSRDVSECGLSSPAPEPHLDGSHGVRRRDSTASSVLLADQNVEQVQRTRAAKLSRHFGTNIPPEVLFRAASPPPPPSPLSLFPVPTSMLSAEHLPRRSASLRRRPARPRPASLVLRPASGIFSAPTSPVGSPRPRSEHRRTLKRSRSLWSRRPKTSDGDENVVVVAAADATDAGLSEKQRIQNVKRAKKMAQLFGDNPPSALFQVTNFGTIVESSDSKRDSLATIISISTTSLSPSLPATSKVRLRDSFISIVTTSSEVSGLVLTAKADEEEDEEDKESPTAQEQDVVDHAPLSPLPILSPLPVSKRKSVRPSTSPNPNRASRTLPVPSSPLVRGTPPPFSNLIPPLQPRPATAPPASPAPSEFQTRRRRAAKLSKFFGVDVAQLADALPTDAARNASTGQEAADVDNVALAVYRQPQDASLVVAEATRRRFLGVNGDELEQRDVHEVIDRLRRL